jgi:hypothetical protein
MSHDMHRLRLTLKQSTVRAQPSPPNAEDRAWHAVRMWPQQEPISESNVQKGLTSLERAPPASSVSVVSCSNATMMHGTVELGDHACLVFDSTCEDVRLKNVTFKGMVSSQNIPDVGAAKIHVHVLYTRSLHLQHLQTALFDATS